MRETQISPEELRAGRIAKGLQQKDVAAQVGVTPTTVSRWECGENSPSQRMQNVLVDLYGLQVETDLPETVGRILLERLDRLEQALEGVRDELRTVLDRPDIGRDRTGH